MHQRQTKLQNIDKPINIQNGVVLEEDTVWKCVFNLVYVHDNSKGKDRGLKNQGYITVHNRIGFYLCSPDSICAAQTLSVLVSDSICENL